MPAMRRRDEPSPQIPAGSETVQTYLQGKVLSKHLSEPSGREMIGRLSSTCQIGVLGPLSLS